MHGRVKLFGCINTKGVTRRMSKGRPVVKDYSWMEDKYAKSWLAGLAAKSQSNYKKQFGEALEFMKMSPTEMIEKRIRDLTSQDLSERQFFELKFREFKAQLEETKATHSSVLAYLKCYASFFARNGVKLNLRRGDWMSTKPQKVIKHYTPTLEEIKRLYTHADVRDKALLTPEQRELIKGHAFLRGKRRQDRNVTSSDKRGGNSKR